MNFIQVLSRPELELIETVLAGNLKNGETLTYRELGGKDRIAMEGFDNTRAYSRIYAILGKLCGYGEDAIMKLKGRDWKAAEALGLVFMIA